MISININKIDKGLSLLNNLKKEGVFSTFSMVDEVPRFPWCEEVLRSKKRMF